ncbi:hypothetical protein PCIT_a2712 [Pseudoalteromonas citrea]|uniref:Uncharacterized protein n=1 Tax=Pseudoalteromonas citrea TaxID=43655 RepID=A0AAD4FRE4_9GAMM|nr:hypothetical protein PCIT_a2712 [Pseudoalteromonas citrea]
MTKELVAHIVGTTYLSVLMPVKEIKIFMRIVPPAVTLYT